MLEKQCKVLYGFHNCGMIDISFHSNFLQALCPPAHDGKYEMPSFPLPLPHPFLFPLFSPTLISILVVGTIFMMTSFTAYIYSNPIVNLSVCLLLQWVS